MLGRCMRVWIEGGMLICRKGFNWRTGMRRIRREERAVRLGVVLHDSTAHLVSPRRLFIPLRSGDLIQAGSSVAKSRFRHTVHASVTIFQ
jgi:hypothetical protein